MAREIDVFNDSIEQIGRTREGLFAAKQLAAVTIGGFHLSHGTPTKDASRIAEGIMRQTNPNLTLVSLRVARSLTDSNPQQ